MVQKTKAKVARPQIGVKAERQRERSFEGFRRAAPKARYVSEEERKKTAAIVRNVERIMASRVVHEGGILRVLKHKEGGNVAEFEKSGPKLSALQTKLRAGQNAARRYVDESDFFPILPYLGFLSLSPLTLSVFFSALTYSAKAEQHQAMLRQTVDEEIKTLEIKKATAKYPVGPVKRKPRAPVPTFAALDDDDVAGSFFDGADGEMEPDDDAPATEAVGSYIPKRVDRKAEMVAKLSAAASMPARKAGFKGVTDAKTAALLEEGF
jgi:hypothetical protein